MSRCFPDWLEAYCGYAAWTEAPRRMHFWCGVSAIAGALQRKVWIDQAYFKWHANFYVVLVAPPGVVSKTTTVANAMNLLKKVPGVRFGPDVVTWQALVTAFAAAREEFRWGDLFYPMSAVTLESGEFGNLLNPHDREMVDLFVTLWDGKEGAFNKVTKMSGNDLIVNPWINMIACTTPAWIAGNFPEYLIGGGFTSRMLFVYAEEKERYEAYPGLKVPPGHEALAEALVHDLEHISTHLVGPYTLSPEAITWGTKWYEEHYRNRPSHLDDDRFGGYIARKQTHIHKTAMILAAATKDEQVLGEKELALANTMVTDLEGDMQKVFARVGRSEISAHAERFIQYIQKRNVVGYDEAYRYIHGFFPDVKDFEGIVSGAIRAGFIRMEQQIDPKTKVPIFILAAEEVKK